MKHCLEDKKWENADNAFDAGRRVKQDDSYPVGIILRLFLSSVCGTE